MRRIEALLALVFLASCGDGTGGWLGGAWVKVKSPNGGETWAVGSEQDIVWTWSGRFEGVRIELSRDGGDSWEALSDSPNTGSCTWTATDPASVSALVRVSAVGGAPEDASDAVFQVVVTGARHVDVDAPGPAHDGKSWASAFLHPQDAVDAAVAGDEVRVAEGTYPLRDSGDVAVLTMKERVNICGGYAGFGQSDPEERKPTVHVTTLDGEDQAYHVVVGASFATIDGFAVTDGDARGVPPDANGGGMFNEDLSGLVVANCTFSSNAAFRDGGGIYNYSSSPTVTNCTFSLNSAVGGGGIYNYSSSPTVTNCTFSLNWAIDGGGMLNLWSYPTVADCTFSKNSAEYGGGMFNFSSSPALMRCVFAGNSAFRAGGGMDNDSSYPTITNCTFSGNSANQDGGGMTNYCSYPAMINSTFSWNAAGWNGDGMCNYTSYPTAVNCIFWGGSATAIYDAFDSSCTIAYSCVRGGYVGPGNVNADPLFVDANGPDSVYGTVDDDLHLRSNSPCIDAADGRIAPAADMDGSGRHNSSTIINTGEGPPWADMGAYEYLGE